MKGEWGPNRYSRGGIHYCQDWVRVVSQPFGTYQNITQTSQFSHSKDSLRDLLAKCYGLIKELPDITTMTLLATRVMVGLGRNKYSNVIL